MAVSQPPPVASPPLVPYGTTFPPLCGGKVVAKPPKGVRPTGRIYNFPLNQPALWAEPIGQCVST